MIWVVVGITSVCVTLGFIWITAVMGMADSHRREGL